MQTTTDHRRSYYRSALLPMVWASIGEI